MTFGDSTDAVLWMMYAAGVLTGLVLACAAMALIYLWKEEPQ